MFRKAVYCNFFPLLLTLPHCCANKPPLLETGASRPENWAGKSIVQVSGLLQVNGAFGQQTSTAGALPVSWQSKRNSSAVFRCFACSQAAAWPGKIGRGEQRFGARATSARVSHPETWSEAVPRNCRGRFVKTAEKHSPNQPLGFVHGNDGELTGAGVTSLKFSVSTGSNRSELTISLSFRIAAIELLPAVCWATRSASLSAVQVLPGRNLGQGQEGNQLVLSSSIRARVNCDTNNGL